MHRPDGHGHACASLCRHGSGTRRRCGGTSRSLLRPRMPCSCPRYRWCHVHLSAIAGVAAPGPQGAGAWLQRTEHQRSLTPPCPTGRVKLSFRRSGNMYAGTWAVLKSVPPCSRSLCWSHAAAATTTVGRVCAEHVHSHCRCQSSEPSGFTLCSW